MDDGYAVVWDDGRRPCPMAGRLDLVDGRAILVGNSPGEPRLLEFDACDVLAAELVTSPRGRLGGRPTLALALADGPVVRIGGRVGVGLAADIALALAVYG